MAPQPKPRLPCSLMPWKRNQTCPCADLSLKLRGPPKLSICLKASASSMPARLSATLAMSTRSGCVLVQNLTSGTPIAGWPEAKVRGMAQNKSRGLAGAPSIPLTTFSLRPILHKYILPHVYPLLMTSAIMIIGCAGVGKTPALIAMALAMGRFHIRRLGLEGVKPGWRRTHWTIFSISCHKSRRLSSWNPCQSKVSIADLKSFVTLDEAGTCDGRYKDARLVRNQMWAVEIWKSGSLKI